MKLHLWLASILTFAFVAFAVSMAPAHSQEYKAGDHLYAEALLCDTKEQILDVITLTYGGEMKMETAMEIVNDDAKMLACAVMVVQFVVSEVLGTITAERHAATVYEVVVFAALNPKTMRLDQVPPTKQYTIHIVNAGEQL